MKKSLEIQEVIEEIKDMVDDLINPIDTVIEVAEDNLEKSIMDNKIEDETDEEISKKYESDNPDEDKWDNVEKACWSSYEQRGMKDKNGRKVPNCVPVEKSYHEDEKPKKEMKKSIWDGSFLK